MKYKGMKNLIGLWIGLFRALEIAKIGGYSVSVHLTKDYREGFEDYQAIKDFCKGWFENFKSEGDINVEISKPDNYEVERRFETLSDISKRIESSWKFERPEITLCSSSQSLLKTACDRLGLSLKQIEKIKSVSATIAQGALSDRIRIEHVAESIQYSFIHADSGYCAESESKKFGEMITIKLGKVNKEDTQAAIAYLNAVAEQ